MGEAGCARAEVPGGFLRLQRRLGLEERLTSAVEEEKNVLQASPGSHAHSRLSSVFLYQHGHRVS